MLLITLGYLFSCEDEKYVSSADVKLLFSVDTVMFDTVFTTIGSTTQHLKIYNPFAQKILISSIKLAKGETSNFRLNVNGVAANEVQNVEIAPYDSMYIFVEVTFNPNGQDLPLVVKDSIEFVTNTNEQDVDLVAWGQDFNLVKGVQIKKNTTWTSRKPYLVYNNAYVDSLAALTIEPGTKIYFHKDAGLYVKGKLVAKGTVENPIHFSGDRLDAAYANIPDQWHGILLYSGSKNNEFANAEIKNAYIGLQVGNIESAGSSSVKLTNVKIQNMTYAGIFAMKSEIQAANCLVTNCGFYGVALLDGGNYEFNHSTIANYWGGYGAKSRNTPALQIQNHLIVKKDKPAYFNDLVRADFYNCIITGNAFDGNELLLSKNNNALFNYKFDCCVLQVADTFKTNNEHFVNILKGINPKFVDPIKKFNFELDTLSKAKDAANRFYSKLCPADLKGRDRLLDAGPDIGALERQEKKSKK